MLTTASIVSIILASVAIKATLQQLQKNSEKTESNNERRK